MKKVYYIFQLMVLIVGCNYNLNKNSSEQVEPLNFEYGDSLLYDLDFIKKIEESCTRVESVLDDSNENRNEYYQNCLFYRIKYNYDTLKTIKKQQLFRLDSVDYFLETANNKSEADDYTFINVYSEKDNTKIDSLTVFSYENYIEALVVKETFFYVKNNKIFTYKFNEDEVGIHSDSWREYEMQDGKFKLIKNVYLRQ